MLTDYRFVDFDNHYYETEDCFTRFIEPSFSDQAVHFVRVLLDDKDVPDKLGFEGQSQAFIGDQPARYITSISGDRFAAPGSLRKDVASLAEGVAAAMASNSVPETVSMNDIPAFIDRDARLDIMDERMTEAAVLHPTTALGLARDLSFVNDPRVMYANLRSFNRWADEEWGFCYKERLFAAPLISLNDVELAVAELDRVLADGARVLELLHFGPGAGHSLGEPACDPFWARVNEAGVAVSIHGDGVHTNLSDTYSPPGHVTSMFGNNAFQLMLASQAMLHMIGSLVLEGTFARFPNLKLVSVEGNGAWVNPTMVSLDALMNSQRLNFSAGGWGAENPSDIMRDHVFLCLLPFRHEVMELTEMVGPERLCMGSDYPHPEGLAAAVDFLDEIGNLSDDYIRMIMRDTGSALLGLRSVSTRGRVSIERTAAHTE